MPTTYHESNFVAVKVSEIDGKRTADIVRKRHVEVPLGADLARVIALGDLAREDTLVFANPNDFHLIRDLSACGLAVVGHMVAALDGSEFTFWDEVVAGCIRPLSELGESPAREALRIVLRGNGTIRHDPKVGWRDYLEIATRLDHYMVDVTDVWRNRDLAPETAAEPSRAKYDPLGSDASFLAVLEARRSTEATDMVLGPSASELSDLCKYSAAARSDGTWPCATPGGQKVIELEVLVLRSPDLAPGRYRFEPHTAKLCFMDDPPEEELVKDLCLRQERFPRPAVLIAVIARPDTIAPRYGVRSHRYVLMTAGAMLHQLQLVATSLGLPSRPLGGFDDALATILFQPAEKAFVAGFLVC